MGSLFGQLPLRMALHIFLLFPSGFICVEEVVLLCSQDELVGALFICLWEVPTYPFLRKVSYWIITRLRTTRNLVDGGMHSWQGNAGCRMGPP